MHPAATHAQMTGKHFLQMAAVQILLEPVKATKVFTHLVTFSACACD
jgi:hypothetical protein